MPEYVVSKVTGALNGKGKSIKGSRILVLGIAYKKNVDDVRESPSVFLMEKLRDLGGQIAYSDPHVPVFPRMADSSASRSSKSKKPGDRSTMPALHLRHDRMNQPIANLPSGFRGLQLILMAAAK